MFEPLPPPLCTHLILCITHVVVCTPNKFDENQIHLEKTHNNDIEADNNLKYKFVNKTIGILNTFKLRYSYQSNQ